MSRYMSSRYASLVPYVPGEQPKNLENRVKLNTNENPYPPSEKAIRMVAEKAASLMLYSDTQCSLLKEKLAEIYGVSTEQIMCTNGSDQALDLCFQAFCDENTPAVFADITYGFYKVFCEANCLPYREIPLSDDMTLNPSDYYDCRGTVFIANPNAPTGIALTRDAMEGIVRRNQDHVIVVDEAYVDFGGESCVPLIEKYPNLIVTMTFSKSRSLAGGRLGFAIGSKLLIGDLETLRNSRDPYNVNSMTQAAGLGVLEDEDYMRRNCQKIKKSRAYLTDELLKLGFDVLPSSTNFVFARHPAYNGEQMYLRLKEKNIYIRHFDSSRLREYNRITVGTDEQIHILLDAVREILEGKA